MIPSYFAIKDDDADAIVKVSISGNNRVDIMNSIDFHQMDDHYHIYALMPDSNIHTLTKVFLFKKIKQDGINELCE